MSDNNPQENVVEIADKKSLNFFERIYYAIFKLDKYNVFLEEKVRVSVKYLLLLLLIVSVVIILFGLIGTNRMINKVKEFVSNDFTEFTYSKGILKAEKVQEYTDEELGIYFKVDTTDVQESKLKEYKSKVADSKYGFLFLKDEFLFSANGTAYETKYEDVFGLEAEDFNKEELTKLLSEESQYKVLLLMFFIGVISTYINITLVTLINVCMVYLIGYIITLLIRLPLRYGSVFNLAVYSFTLSIILNLIYSVVYYFTNYEISNFDTIYMIIAYIYIIASLLILKQNMINTDKVIRVERKVTIEDLRKQEEKEKQESEKELDRLEKEKKERKKKSPKKRTLKPKDSLEDNEPDGSEI